MTEDCTNGVDDNGDSKIDCADPECSAYECVGPAPPNFGGFYRIVQSPYPNANPAPCPGSTPSATYFDGPSLGTCNACACDPPSATCGAPQVTCYGNSKGCTSGSFDATPNADLSCPTANLTSGANSSCKITQDPPVIGGCAPTGGGLKVPAPWTSQDDVCGAQMPGGGGCAAGVCVPKGDPVYGNICVKQAGDQACGGAYPTKTLAHTGEADGRSCSACACDPGSLTCTGEGVTAWNHSDCTDSFLPWNDKMCHDVSSYAANGAGALQLTTAAKVMGTCPKSGGAASGTVVPNDNVTFCCKP